MSYEITIGEKYTYKQGGHKYIGAKEVKLENAPAYGEPTDYTNKRWPSYSGWADFCRYANIDPKSIIPTHPGFTALTVELHKQLNQKYIEYKAKYPDAIPTFERNEKDAHFARFTWLIFWVNWAIENCKNPVITNT